MTKPLKLHTKKYRDGEPCDHPGCLHHLSHPCENCGRIGGGSLPTMAKGSVTLNNRNPKMYKINFIIKKSDESNNVPETAFTEDLNELKDRLMECLKNDPFYGKEFSKLSVEVRSIEPMPGLLLSDLNIK
jgi:hypothetical protein